MAGWNKTNVQLGDSTTPTNNFCLDATAQNGTMKLARGNAGATTQDIATVNGSGVVDFTQGLTIGGSSGQKMLLTASQVTTSGTSVDFTGIPNWANRVTVLINGVSTNGSSQVLIQVGTSGGVVATGYVATANDDSTGTPTTTGFPTGQTDSAGGLFAVRYSRLVLERQAGNNWLGFGQTYNSVVTNAVYQLGGLIALSGVLDRVRVTTVSGTDTFDAGSVSLLIEGY